MDEQYRKNGKFMETNANKPNMNNDFFQADDYDVFLEAIPLPNYVVKKLENMCDQEILYNAQPSFRWKLKSPRARAKLQLVWEGGDNPNEIFMSPK